MQCVCSRGNDDPPLPWLVGWLAGWRAGLLVVRSPVCLPACLSVWLAGSLTLLATGANSKLFCKASAEPRGTHRVSVRRVGWFVFPERSSTASARLRIYPLFRPLSELAPPRESVHQSSELLSGAFLTDPSIELVDSDDDDDADDNWSRSLQKP